MRTRLAVAVAAVPIVLGGCGGSSSQGTGETHVMSDGTTMSGSMSQMHMNGKSDMNMSGKSDPKLMIGNGGAGSPSASARMICGPEIRRAVARTLQRPQVPRGLHVWGDRIFACSYQLPGGTLRLSVKDLDSAAPGRAYFDHLRRSLPGSTTVKGVASYGFPAFETAQGDVVFLKDHKTLWVDAGRLTRADLPAGTSREDAAYGVAAAVIACWTE